MMFRSRICSARRAMLTGSGLRRAGPKLIRFGPSTPPEDSRPGVDPYLYLRDTAGQTVIDQNDDGGAGTQARLDFTPQRDGRYYVQVKNKGEVGAPEAAYALQITLAGPPKRVSRPNSGTWASWGGPPPGWAAPPPWSPPGSARPSSRIIGRGCWACRLRPSPKCRPSCGPGRDRMTWPGWSRRRRWPFPRRAGQPPAESSEQHVPRRAGRLPALAGGAASGPSVLITLSRSLPGRGPALAYCDRSCPTGVTGRTQGQISRQNGPRRTARPVLTR